MGVAISKIRFAAQFYCGAKPGQSLPAEILRELRNFL